MGHGSLKRRLSIAVILIALSTCPATAEELSAIFPERDAGTAVLPIEIVDLTRILDFGIERELMIFEVFNAVALHLADLGVRARISGEALREAASLYDLGGDRVEALLPVSKVVDVHIGKGVSGGLLEVVLAEKHETFLENEAQGALNQARIKLSEQYGFEEIIPGSLGGGYGVTVKRFVFSVKMESLEIYAKNKVAIHVRGLSRVKRWRIRRLVRKPQAEAG